MKYFSVALRIVVLPFQSLQHLDTCNYVCSLQFRYICLSVEFVSVEELWSLYSLPFYFTCGELEALRD